jgi:hypothetical protein
MRLFGINQLLLFLWLLSPGFFALGQLSKKHYIPPLTISEEEPNNTPNQQWIYISTPFNSNVQYVITPLGGGSDIVGLV